MRRVLVENPWALRGTAPSSGTASGELTRRALLSKYLHYESPLPPTSATPTLTGTSWHWPLNATACGGCLGTCAAPLDGAVLPLARCDCGPNSWGVRCELSVRRRAKRRRCFLNDSDAWACVRPACTTSTVSDGQCIGKPVDRCPGGCSGRGECVAVRPAELTATRPSLGYLLSKRATRETEERGWHPTPTPNERAWRCRCSEGYTGAACEQVQRDAESTCYGGCSGRGQCEAGFCRCTPPFWGIDCRMGPSGLVPPLRCTASPCVYVYELPARMNVLAEKADPRWRVSGDFKYRAPSLFLEALLLSPHRTALAAEADYFYVPVVEWEGCWGPLDGFYRAHRYISTFYPWFNASGGADHIWAISRDGGSCDLPWGSLQAEMGSSIVLTHWGGRTGLDGTLKARCFDAARDLVMPAASRAAPHSPHWPTHLAAAAAAAAATAEATMVVGAAGMQSPSAVPAVVVPRTTQLFFSGALCWSRGTLRARDWSALERKCNASWSGGGTAGRVVRRYSFGLRLEVWRLHREAEGFRLLATDFPPSLPPDYFPPTRRLSNDDEMRRARFCLCPSGAGWGMRAVHAVIMGCVPVLIQHDGSHAPVAQAFEPQGLSWDDFGVRVRHDQVAELPALLRAVDLPAKQAALRRVWARMVWRRTLPALLAAALPGPDAFDTIMEMLRAKKAK